MTGAPLLQLQGINKHFPGVHALIDVQFDVRRGEVHALIGENPLQPCKIKSAE